MAINWVLAVRGVQVVLSLVVLGLMAYVSSWWTGHWHQMSPSEVDFTIFAPVWSLLAGAALIVVPWKFPHVASNTIPKFALFAVEIITMLFWFGGFIALAVFLSDRICFGTVCNVAKAGTAISAFQWVAWAATAAMSTIRMFKGGNRGGMSVEPKVQMHQGV